MGKRAASGEISTRREPVMSGPKLTANPAEESQPQPGRVGERCSALASCHQMQAESRGRVQSDNQIQVDSAKDRTPYFEKLTIGCGAAIAATVSFLGGSDKHALHPTWVLRCSLVALVVCDVRCLVPELSLSKLRDGIC
jgi:hypothetical protein